MAQFKNYFVGLSKNTFLLALASLFADISTEMLYPMLPLAWRVRVKNRQNRRVDRRHRAGHTEHSPRLLWLAVGQVAETKIGDPGRLCPGGSCQSAPASGCSPASDLSPLTD
jgi:hypothetical protein